MSRSQRKNMSKVHKRDHWRTNDCVCMRLYCSDTNHLHLYPTTTSRQWPPRIACFRGSLSLLQKRLVHTTKCPFSQPTSAGSFAQVVPPVWTPISPSKERPELSLLVLFATYFVARALSTFFHLRSLFCEHFETNPEHIFHLHHNLIQLRHAFISTKATVQAKDHHPPPMAILITHLIHGYSWDCGSMTWVPWCSYIVD